MNRRQVKPSMVNNISTQQHPFTLFDNTALILITVTKIYSEDFIIWNSIPRWNERYRSLTMSSCAGGDLQNSSATGLADWLGRNLNPSTRRIKHEWLFSNFDGIVMGCKTNQKHSHFISSFSFIENMKKNVWQTCRRLLNYVYYNIMTSR